MLAVFDTPLPNSVCDPLSFRIEGWIYGAADHEKITTVEIWSAGRCIAHTFTLARRPDVAAALSLPATTRTGFSVDAHCAHAAFGSTLTFTLHVIFPDGNRSAALLERTVATATKDYRKSAFGAVLDSHTVAIQRRGNIFVTGPSISEPSPVIINLLARYLPTAPARILDVGCGLGSYARGLLAQGYHWHGAEVGAADCEELARQKLPHTRVAPGRLPFDDATFDAAMCIEVLEHIDDARPFLREVRRVAPRQLIVSVPNCELLGYLHDYLATPWHMLEGDHKNFFSRWSLGSLLREFYPRVEVGFHTPHPLPTPEGAALHYNLYAVATVA